MANTDKKIKKLVEATDTPEMVLIENAVMRGTAWGICKKPGCDYTTEVEPDQTHGWCEHCNSQTVQSILVMKGMM